MVKLLTAPPTLEDSHLRQTEWGAFLLYYLATFVMRLVFGSFTVPCPQLTQCTHSHCMACTLLTDGVH
jgi:hypothetical protein